MRNPGLAARVFSLPVGVDSRVTESSESSLGTLGLGDLDMKLENFLLSSTHFRSHSPENIVIVK